MSSVVKILKVLYVVNNKKGFILTCSTIINIDTIIKNP